MLLYFLSNVEIKSDIDGFLLNSSKSLNLSQPSDVSSFYIFPSGNVFNLSDSSLAFNSLIDMFAKHFFTKFIFILFWER